MEKITKGDDMYRFLAALISIILLTSYPARADFDLLLAGQKADPHPEPRIVDGKALVPARWVAHSLGLTLEWQENTKQIVVSQGENTISFAPLLLKNKAYIPLRLLERLDYSVYWDEETTTAVIGKDMGSPVDWSAVPVLRQAFEDRSWMQALTKAEMQTILAGFYSETLAAQLVAEAWPFIAQPTDWHSTTEVKKLQPIYHDLQRQVFLLELEDCQTDQPTLFGHGLYALVKLDEQWRIDYFKIKWRQN